MVFAEPYRIKVVEPIRMTTREEREKILEEAGYNLFMVKAEDIFIDLLTDSGTNAMSHYQWAGLMIGDESYAGCRNFFHLQEVVKELFGFDYFVPTHQGRPAENILFMLTIRAGDYIPNNMHFDSTRAHVIDKGGVPADLVIDEAYELENEHPFKGDMDIDKLEGFIRKIGAKKIPFIMLTLTNNTGGGHPVSMGNIKEVRRIADRYGIPLFFDAARFAENAYLIKEREPGYSDKSVKEIVLEMMSYSDGFTMSCKKDGLVNIGGLLAMRDKRLFERAKQLLILMEGFPTYGGLAGRDLEALAIGLKEVIDEAYLAWRIQQVRYLGEKLRNSGIPVSFPIGGHAVYVDIKRFLPHVPQSLFPDNAFATKLYLEAGIRTAALGSTAFATEDKETGKIRYPELELVRLTIPRRVYTNSHMDYVAEAVTELYKKRDTIKGLRVVYEPELLRHFSARFEPVE